MTVIFNNTEFIGDLEKDDLCWRGGLLGVDSRDNGEEYFGECKCRHLFLGVFP